MPQFADGFAANRTFDDFDAMASAIPAWNLEFARIGVGAFAARVEVASTASLQIARLVVNTPMLATGTVPRGASGIALVLAAPGGARSRARDIDPLTTAPGRVQGQEVHFVAGGPVEAVTVAAEHGVFLRHLRAVSGLEVAALGPDWWLYTPPGTPDCAERGRAVVALQSVLARGGVFSPEARRRLEECVLQILLDGFAVETAQPPRSVASGLIRRSAARRVEEALRARLDDPPSLRELCELVGAPERTLHHAFHESFGLAPKTYLRALRLNAAHRRLGRGQGPVTVVATDLGLFHFGRFAAEYRAMFGETPSQTLRRATGAAPTAESGDR